MSMAYPSLPGGLNLHQYAPMSALHGTPHYNGQNMGMNGLGTLPMSMSDSRQSLDSTSPSSASLDPLTPPERSPSQPIEERRMSASDSASAAGGAKQEIVEDQIECKWADCRHLATTPDELYDHLCNNHVGRKSTGNLNLTCGWEGCGVKCVKRDHITSHLRVHTPLKPHPCSVCGKSFKRPQDLKKHERIHTTEHHQLHKLFKAATSTDPAFNSRVAASSNQARPLETRRSSGYESTDKSVSPTPSALAALHRRQHEELAAYQQREMMVLQQLAYQQQQTQAYAARFAQDSVPRGIKRGQGDIDELWSDVKKKKLEPVYNGDMINRLNGMVPPSLPPLPSLHSGGNYSSYGPSSNVFGSSHNMGLSSSGNSMGGFPMPEIRTEADLAMFNQFMISLGRDAAGLGNMSNNADAYPQPMMGSSFSGSSASGSPLSDQSPIEDLFNPEELASLGLGSMPGLSMNGHANNMINFGGMYPTLDNHRSRATSAPDVAEFGKRTIANLPRNQSMSSAPKFDMGLPPVYPDMSSMSTGHGMDQFNFDFLAHSKPNVGASMQPRDFTKKTYRHVAPLGASVSSRMRMHESSLRSTEADEDEDVRDDETISGPRTPEADLDLDETPHSTPKISVRSLLTANDLPNGKDFELPAIHVDEHAHPSTRHVDLPSLRELTAPTYRGPPTKRQMEDDIVRGVKRMELADGEARPLTADEHERLAVPSVMAKRVVDPERMKHAAMIKAWLVAVNLDFRKKQMQAREDELDEDDYEAEVKLERDD